MSARPLWERALEARDDERAAARHARSVAAGRKSGGRPREYPAISVGQRYGDWRVIELLGRGIQGRRDMRVALVCKCGRRSETFEYLARNFGTCRHAHANPKARAANRGRAP